MVREGGMVEAAQYLVGFMGALEAVHQLWALVLLLVPTALVYVAFKHTKEMHTETRRILESMADMVDLRDPTTGGHSRRVTLLTEGILQELQKAGPEVGLIVSAARVHDIGKIGIHDDILQRPAS
jgi:response regulator RpfG family c-di-GMP phosphodiesterase